MTESMEKNLMNGAAAPAAQAMPPAKLDVRHLKVWYGKFLAL